MSGHTKGPWVYDKKFNRIISSEEWFVEPEDDLEGIHTTIIETFGAMGGKETAADIALICAAPELLEACCYTISNLESAEKEQLITAPAWFQVQITESMKLLYAAIAKAEGK
jgi:hypothetical protein